MGVIIGLLMRLETDHGPDHHGAQTYNALFTVHGVMMIFLFIIPGFPGVLRQPVMPIQIGARDVAFPRLNLLSWWLYMAGAVIV